MPAWLLAAGLATLACAAVPGQALFDSAGCRACHKIGSRGGNTGPDLTMVGLRRSSQWLDLWLQNPRGWKKSTLMPNFRLKAADRAALVDFLASQKGQAWEGILPWAAATAPPARGRLIFQRAGCVACHGAQGSGGQPNNNVPGGLIPALNAVAGAYTPTELARAIARGSRPEKADPLGPEPLVAMPSWKNTLAPADIDAVGAYLLSLAPAEGSREDW